MEDGYLESSVSLIELITVRIETVDAIAELGINCRCA